MSDEAAHGDGAPARRGRRAHKPAAAKTTVRAGSKKLDGGQLTKRLNELVAELINENRKLKREVVKLTERLKVAATSVKRGARTIQRRVKKAKTAPAKRRPRKTVTAAATRKRAVRKTVTAAATRKKGVTKKRRKT
jgi:hypothetical protein